MKLMISNVKQFGDPIEARVLAAYISSRLTALNIKCSMQSLSDRIEITSKEGPKYLFTSSKVNRIPLKPDDPRIEKIGRTYLESERITKKQFDNVIRVFNEHLNAINVSCSIVLSNFEDEPLKTILLRDGVKQLNNWVEPKSFPVEAV